MPCYATRYISIRFDAAHVDLMTQALEAAGYYPKGARQMAEESVATGSLRIGGYGAVPESIAAEVKQRYAQAAIKRAAKRLRWTVKQKAPGKVTLRR